MTSNPNKRIAYEIKDALVQLAVNDELPLDMTLLDVGFIQKILNENYPRSVFGFTAIDVRTVEEEMNENGRMGKFRLSDNDIDRVMDIIEEKVDVYGRVGWANIRWAIEDFLDKNLDNSK